mmetsp:Transcript_11790/g.26713  ORF Transcript_11790/g.26713 Transcript_11790/m.26713 type:complete len:258 (+) Transcript_11790:1058-1831(+)
MICLFLQHQGLSSLLHLLQIRLCLLSLLRVQPAFHFQSYLHVFLSFLESSTPQISRAYSQLHSCPHHCILRIFWWGQLALWNSPAGTQHIERSSAILYTLGEVPQIEIGDGSIRKSASIQANLECLRVGIVGTLIIACYHEIVRLVLEPHRIVLILLRSSSHHRWKVTLDRSLWEWWCPLTAITHRNARSRTLGEANANLSRIVSRRWNILFKSLVSFHILDLLHSAFCRLPQDIFLAFGSNLLCNIATEWLGRWIR